MNSQPKSKCCGASVTSRGDDEGTYWYSCDKCDKPCDIQPSMQDIKPHDATKPCDDWIGLDSKAKKTICQNNECDGEGIKYVQGGHIHIVMTWSTEKHTNVCGALIHVGFEGSTTCANPKPCFLHNEDGSWKTPAKERSGFELDNGTAGVSANTHAENRAEEKCNCDCHHGRDVFRGFSGVCRNCGCAAAPSPAPWEKKWKAEFETLFGSDCGRFHICVGNGDTKNLEVKEVIAFISSLLAQHGREERERGMKIGATYWCINDHDYSIHRAIESRARREQIEEILNWIEQENLPACISPSRTVVGHITLFLQSKKDALTPFGKDEAV